MQPQDRFCDVSCCCCTLCSAEAIVAGVIQHLCPCALTLNGSAVAHRHRSYDVKLKCSSTETSPVFYVPFFFGSQVAPALTFKPCLIILSVPMEADRPKRRPNKQCGSNLWFVFLFFFSVNFSGDLLPAPRISTSIVIEPCVFFGSDTSTIVSRTTGLIIWSLAAAIKSVSGWILPSHTGPRPHLIHILLPSLETVDYRDSQSGCELF